MCLYAFFIVVCFDIDWFGQKVRKTDSKNTNGERKQK